MQRKKRTGTKPARKLTCLGTCPGRLRSREQGGGREVRIGGKGAGTVRLRQHARNGVFILDPQAAHSQGWL